MPDQSASTQIRILHLGLIASLLVALLAFAVLGVRGLGPLLTGPERYPVAMFTAAGAFGPILLGLLAFRPRLPRRRRGETAEQFWSSTETRGLALLVWALCEGGGMVGAVGYLLSGSLVPAAVAAIGLAALVMFGPGRLASEQD